MLRITLVLFIVGELLGQVKFSDSCSIPNTVQNFEVGKYMGKWYEFAKYGVQTGIRTRCLTASSTLTENGSFHTKNNLLLSGKPYTYEYTAVPISNPRNGKFKLTPGGALYWVLATDYTNWALVSSCTNSRGMSVYSTWIFTRVLNPSDQVIKAAYVAAAANHLSKTDFTPTNKEGCPESF